MLITDVKHDLIIEVGMSINDQHPMTCAVTMMGESILQRCLIGTRGSVVKITMPGSQVKLQLCQVEIYGYPGKLYILLLHIYY